MVIYDQLQALLSSNSTKVVETLTGYQQVNGDWRIPTRSLFEEYLIYFVCSGSVSAITTGTTFQAGPGSLLWLMPGTEHTFRTACLNKPPRLYHFRFILANSALPSPENQYLLGHNMDDSGPLITMYYHDMKLAPPDINFRIKNILSLLLSNLRNSTANAGDSKTAGFNKQTINRLIEFGRNNIKSRPAPRDLARHVQLSEDYFSRVFKQTFGISARQWLVKQRIMAIAEELQSSLRSVSEVAYEYGYEDIFFFSRQFKQVMGKSPRNWLNQR